MPLDQTLCYRALRARDPRFDGRFFTAVKTTGIYCRPICPARTPKLENVEFYPTAASAQEAGYRPCLRCRPEVSPRFAAWRGTWNSVARALLLIDQGALDTGDVDHLATRLGMTSRHLRRLFDQHLGAPPIVVAQTRRLQLAKQLLDETTLPISHIAYSSGFGSLRRFNDAIRKTYDRTPKDIRRATKRRHPQDNPVMSSLSSVTLKLPFAPPYNWPALIAFLAARAIPGIEHITPTSYRRAITHDGNTGIVEVHPNLLESHLTVTIHFPNITPLGAIVDRIRHIFDTGADPLAIARTLTIDPLLADALHHHPGIRVPGTWDGFELAIRAILGQQITVRAATNLAAKVVALYGTPLTTHTDPTITHTFPSPKTIAHIPPNTLAQSLGIPRVRAEAITALAATAATDDTLLKPGHSLDHSIARLTELPGIGDWTANYIAMRALREPDAFPATDLILRKSLTANGTTPTLTQTLTRATSWQPWRAYAAMALWTRHTATHAIDQ